MSYELQIAIDGWLPGDCPNAEERLTLAEIAIKIGPYCATQVEDRLARTIRGSVRVSAMLLAAWMLDNWWRLRWEPSRDFDLSTEQRLDWEMSHSLAAVGGGYDWPPISIASDGRDISLRCAGNSGNDLPELSPIRYINSFEKVIPASEFERGVACFVETVIARLDSSGLRKTPLHDLWEETNRERRDSSSASRRKLEAMLGLDPGREVELVSTVLTQWEPKVGRLALDEIAASVGSMGVGDALRRAETASATSKLFADLSTLDKLKKAMGDTKSLTADAPWQSARQTANGLRKAWGFGLTEPIATSQIANLFKLTETELRDVNANAPFPVGVRADGEGKLKLVLNRSREESRRFDIARLIGDHLVVDSSDPWLPATGAKTSRQKFQRAFAAEFLCPSDMLVKHFDSPLSMDAIDDEVADIANRFAVSQQVVARHLENRNLVSASLIDNAVTPF